MNGDFFNYQNKHEHPVWHAWRGDEILLLLLTLMLWGENVILMFVIFRFYNSSGGFEGIFSCWLKKSLTIGFLIQNQRHTQSY